MYCLYSKLWDSILEEVGVFLKSRNLFVGALNIKKKKACEGKN